MFMVGGGQSLLLLLSSPTTMLLYCFCCCSLKDALTLALFRPPSLEGETETISHCCTSAAVEQMPNVCGWCPGVNVIKISLSRRMCSWFISPLQIYQPSLMSNGWLDSVGKLDSIFFLLPFGNNEIHVLRLMSKPTCSQVQLHDTHLLMHSGHVPHVAHDGPAGHHPQQVTDHAILGAVPESISKLWVILKIE